MSPLCQISAEAEPGLDDAHAPRTKSEWVETSLVCMSLRTAVDKTCGSALRCSRMNLPMSAAEQQALPTGARAPQLKLARWVLLSAEMVRASPSQRCSHGPVSAPLDVTPKPDCVMPSGV